MILGAEACATTLGLTGQSKTNESFGPELSSGSDMATGHLYDISMAVVFNCSIYLNSSMGFHSSLESCLRASQALPGFDTTDYLGPTWEIFEISTLPSSLISVSASRIGVPRSFGFPPTLATISAIA